MSNKGHLFWDDNNMFDRRKKIIIDKIMVLEEKEAVSFKINNYLHIFPRGYKEEEGLNIPYIFYSNSERFQGPGKLYAISSSDPGYLVGNGRDAFCFTLEEIKHMKFTLTNDYISQLILLFLMY